MFAHKTFGQFGDITVGKFTSEDAGHTITPD